MDNLTLLYVSWFGIGLLSASIAVAYFFKIKRDILVSDLFGFTVLFALGPLAVAVVLFVFAIGNSSYPIYKHKPPAPVKGRPRKK